MNSAKFGTFAIALGLLTLAGGASRAADNPLAQFAGNWSGSGTITVQNGGRERIRCRGNHTSSDSTLNLSLRCASDSYKFELQSSITYDSGTVSGSWNETTRQVYGSLSGSYSKGHIEALAQSVGFNATMSLTTRGNRQQVSIKSPGSEISEVAISLARSGR